MFLCIQLVQFCAKNKAGVRSNGKIQQKLPKRISSASKRLGNVARNNVELGYDNVMTSYMRKGKYHREVFGVIFNLFEK